MGRQTEKNFSIILKEDKKFCEKGGGNMLASKDNEEERLVAAMLNKEISPAFLQRKGWKEAGEEQIAAYFASVAGPFQTVRKIIHFISGSLILYQCQEQVKVEVFHPLKMAKELFNETDELIKSMNVHAALQAHHQLLLQALAYLKPVFKELKMDEAMIYLTKNQIAYILTAVANAYENLQKASTFELDLNMVAIDSSCAGHSH
jgi:hypothetical protein